jgi:hypothetical protein
MAATDSENTHTTLWVSKELRDRLDELKPYDSLSWEEFLSDVADVYEENQR